MTFKHVDGAILAFRESSKKIDGSVTVTQLVATGTTGSRVTFFDMVSQKIYVREVPVNMPSDKLLLHFSCTGRLSTRGSSKLQFRIKSSAKIMQA